jgi:acid phosphatase type 7
MGNHEVNQDANGTAYFNYFNGTGNATGPAGSRTNGYYAFNWGPYWRIIVLNSNCTFSGGAASQVGCAVGTRQYNWLVTELNSTANTSKKCTAIMTHHARWSAGAQGNGVVGSSTQKQHAAKLDPMWKLAWDKGVDVWFGAHDHLYQRYNYLNKTGGTATSSTSGLRNFVLGMGGKKLGAATYYNAGTPSLAPAKYDTTHYGVLRMELGDGDYSWRFVATNGTTYDQGTGTCKTGTRP